MKQISKTRVHNLVKIKFHKQEELKKNKIYDVSIVWIFQSKTTHDKNKTQKNETKKKNGTNQIALPSESEFKTNRSSAKFQFLKAKLSIIRKTNDTSSNAKIFMAFLSLFIKFFLNY